MFRWMVGSSLRARGLVIAIAAGVMFLGAQQLRSMPADALPEFTQPTVHIQSEALGLSAREVEDLITAPFEQDLLNGVPFLTAIRSESMPGLSSIELVFEPGTDIFRARQVVQERLAEAVVALPGASRPPQMLQPVSSTGRAMIIGLSSEQLSLIELSVLARWTVKPRLLGVPGVANVSVWGNRDQQLQVHVDPERLRAHEVTLQQIIETTGNALWVSPLSFLEASTPGTGGFIDTPNQRLAIQHLLPVRTPEDLAQIAVDDTGPQPLRLGDVATVVEDHQPLIGNALLAGGPGLLLVIEKFPEADILEVTRHLDEALETLRPALKGVTVDASLFRPAASIERATSTVGRALLIGFVLMIVMLFLVFMGWREALIVAITVPLSLLATAAIMGLTGLTLNAMTGAGLVMGLALVIDDAITGVDAVVRRTRRGEARPGGLGVRAVHDTVLAVRSPLAYGTAIVVLAVMPLFLLDGVAGAFLPSLAWTFALAAITSMIVALTVAPALALALLGRASAKPDTAAARGTRGLVARMLPRFLRSRTPLIVALVVTVAGFAVLPFLRHSSDPGIQERHFAIDLEAAPGTSLPEMTRITQRMAREIRGVDGVDSVAIQVGRAITSDRVVNVNAGELWVSVSPSAPYRQTIDRIRSIVAGYPGFDQDIGTYTKERVTDELSGVEHPVTVRLFGSDLDVLREKADEVRSAIAGVEGVEDAAVSAVPTEPTVEVEVDLTAAETLGIKPGDVRRAAATLLAGIHVGSLFEEQKVFDVVVWSSPETRYNISSLQDLLIETPEGRPVRLGDVASVHLAPNPTVVRHEAVSRTMDVTAGVRGRGLGAVLADIERRIDGIAFPLEHHAEIMGDFDTQQAGKREFIVFAIAAAIGALLIAQASVRSWVLALLAILLAGASLAGGAVAVLLTDGIVSLGSIAGFLLLFVLALRHLLGLLDRYHRLRYDGVAFDRRLRRRSRCRCRARGPGRPAGTAPA